MYEECEFEWNLSHVLPNPCFSKTFPENPSNFCWQIQKNYSLYGLRSTKAPAGEIKVTCKYSIGSNFRVMTAEFTKNINKEDSIMNIEIVSRRNDTRNNTLLCESSFSKIKVNIWAYLVKSKSEELMFDKHSATLLSSMLKDSDFCDLVIKTGSTDFKVHKSTFAAVSPVFKAMLLNNMLEKQSNCIVIKDCTSDIVEKMIHFIYHGDIASADYLTIVELLKISDMYNIESLKQYCIHRAKDIIDNNNVIQIMLKADLSNAPDLKNYAIDYFIQNIRVYSANEFDEVRESRPDLLTELLAKMSENLSAKNDRSQDSMRPSGHVFQSYDEVADYYDYDS